MKSRVLAALLAFYVSPLPAIAAGGDAGQGSVIRPTIINWALTPEQIKSSCAEEIARVKHTVAEIAATPEPWTFANITLKLEDAVADFSDRTAAQGFLSQVSPDAKVRAVSLDCANDLGAFAAELTADPALYQRLVAAGKTTAGLSDADKALSKLWIEQFQRSGAGLEPAQRTEFVKLSKELNDLQLHFTENIQNDKTTVTITKAQTAGLPAEFLAQLKGTDGGYVVPVNDSTVLTFLQNASDENARRAYYIAYNNIAPDNVALLERAIAVRYQLAHLLGFPSWAAYQLDNRVDRSPAHIEKFLKDLDAQLLPRAREQINELAALKAKSTGNPQAKIYPWDTNYYLSEHNKERYTLNQQEVKRYFPAGPTVDAILKIYENLLGVRFTKMESVNGWAPGLTEYAVTDQASGKFLGTFLLDLYAREGKPGGAFTNPILPVRRLADGTYRPPVSSIVVSDWPAQSPGKPVLLTHQEVTTFFHEFGHNMAALLTTVPYESLAQFPQDFVEAPSQMLENFTWDPGVLKQISSSVDTGKPLPDDLIAKIVASRCSNDRICNAYQATRQLLLSLVDLDYYTAGPQVDTTAVWARVDNETTPVAWVPGTHPQTTFGHIMGSYSAGYYVYLWSLVYAQDMFTAFQKGGIENPAVGTRYRQDILAPAYTYGPDVEVRNFLGRPMSPDAFYNGFKNAP
jgi:thimet oligopeptidase